MKSGRTSRISRKSSEVKSEEIDPTPAVTVDAPVSPEYRERVLRAWIPPGFTRSAFRTMVEAFKLGAPWTFDDLAEIKSQIQANIPAGYALDIVLRPAGYVHDRQPLPEPRFEVSVFGDERLATDWIAVPT